MTTSETSPIQPHRSDAQGIHAVLEAIFERNLAITVTSHDQDLLSSGRLDSLTIVRLVSLIEERFGVELPMGELGIDSFRSLDAIADLLRDRAWVPSRSQTLPAPSQRDGTVSEIKELIEERLLVRIDDVRADLYDGGCLDSMSLVQLILELETRYELELPIQDLDLKAFESVVSIAELIRARKSVAAAAVAS